MTVPEPPPDDERLEDQIAEILDRVTNGQALEAVLDEICAAHPDLAKVLRERVAKAAALGLVPGHTLPDTLPAPSRTPKTSDRIGAYEIVRSLGRGGMGEVFLARQAEPVEREVALKITQTGGDSSQLLARFESERQALARLNHDGIARVFEAGSTDDGRPYFAMEYVAGAPITTYCDERRLGIAERLVLFGRVCEAVHHAHQNGIIHRDLKPSNILVREQDGVAVPKVIDFGLAKAISDRHEPREEPQLTQVGQIVGTPEYMSPEQADLDGVVDTRTDVYSLGVVLYELLAGRLPFESSELRDGGFSHLQRILREVEPKRPSTRITAASEDALRQRGAATSTALIRKLRGDLDWITLKALAKDPRSRYASVSELAADVRRHLADETVLASPPSTTYRLRKFVRRNRGTVVAAALVGVSLMVGFVLVVVQNSIAQAYLAKIDGTVDGQTLADLRLAADNLWPAHPDREEEFVAWLADADELVGRLDARDAQLVELRRTAVAGDAGEGLRFEQYRDTILHRELSRLVADLRAFAAADGQIAEVRGRLAWARDLTRLTLDEPRADWQRAIAEIADPAVCPKYDGLEITPQLGLIPIGRDARSGLWEFRLPQLGGAAPERDADGTLIVTERTDLVFVLVPGGLLPFFGRDVRIDPFLVSKYEVTQGQWERLTGTNPSRFAAGRSFTVASGHPAEKITASHPVEQVNWNEATRWLGRLGLDLPTEAQWEYAGRGGRSTRYWTGDDPSTLRQTDGRCAANVADLTAAKTKAIGEEGTESAYDDGYALHAPVDALLPSPFGLHHVHGNVWEWCRDIYHPTTDATPRDGDGLLTGGGADNRPWRGGSFNGRFYRAAFDHRIDSSKDTRSAGVGLRPGLAVHRPR